MRWVGVATTLCLGLGLGACQSTRVATLEPAARTGPVYNAPPLEPSVAVPSGAVVAEPLPPPPGTPGPIASIDPGIPPIGAPGPGPVVADVPMMPGSPRPIETLPSAAPTAPQQVAAVAAPGRANVVGGWTAREASGSCKVQLSSSPSLDLYKASAAGCQNRDLSRVTAWDFRDGEVFLYQPGGAVAARLRPSGGAMSGVFAKSGAPLTLER